MSLISPVCTASLFQTPLSIDGQLSSLTIVIERLRKKIEEGYKSSQISPTYLADIRLITDISCYTEYAVGRDLAIRCYLRPLLLPPISITHLLKPLEVFLLKESREDPWFRITIKERDEGDENVMGRFYPKTGTIDLFVPSVMNPLTLLPASKTSLIHEICHKIIHKLVWNNQPSYPPSTQLTKISSAVETDKGHQKKASGQKPHSAVMKKLNEVRLYGYSSYEERMEEYFVRIPEMLFMIANEEPHRSLKEIEEILFRDVPCLYKIYKEEFLPALIAYNCNRYKTRAKLTPLELRKKAETQRRKMGVSFS